MFKRFLLGSAGVMVAAGMVTTSASALLIDNFTTGPQKMQIVNGTAADPVLTGKLLDNAPGCALVADIPACTDGSGAGTLASFSQSGVGPVAGILGGYRDIQTTMVVGSPEGSATSALANFAGGVSFSHNQDSGAASNTFITWGGTGDQLAGAGIVAGAGGADLTDGGLSDKFHLLIINADAGVVWSLQLIDSDGDSALHTFANGFDIPPADGNLYLALSIWTGLNPLLNMASIDFIRFGANITNVANFDTTVDLFETIGVPEPASLTLLGAGVMGLGAIKRRRKAA